MALGYTIAAILKRSSHVFCDERVCVKIDWLEQVNRHYVQVQGRDRLAVQCVAEQLGLEGSYVPRTYIEQIQLEKLVNEVMALPDDLKTKLSIDEDLVSSPKEALSRASADRVAMRKKFLKSFLPHSYSTARDKNLTTVTGFAVNSRGFDDRTAESNATLANQGAMSHLSEQISTLNDRMDEFTSRIEELNSKFTGRKVSASQQNMAVQVEPSNGSASTSYFGLGNGSFNGSTMLNSSSSLQLTKESPLLEELSGLARGQRKIMHQLDNLSNLCRENLGEIRSLQERTGKKATGGDFNPVMVSLLLTIVVGGLGIFMFKGYQNQN